VAPGKSEAGGSRQDDLFKAGRISRGDRCYRDLEVSEMQEDSKSPTASA
jgi:hypothetical protein